MVNSRPLGSTLIKAALLGAGLSLLGAAQTPLAATAPRGSSTESTAVRNLINQGQYWFDRYRFDLATQAFNKALLIEPGNAEALKWKGLLDVGSSNPGAARLWLDRLSELHGPQNPHGLELEQTLRMSTDLRTRISEIQFLSRQENRSKEWLPALKSLFGHKPLGQAAVLVYGLLKDVSEAERQYARLEVQRLIAQFPQDRRYPKLLADLGGQPVSDNLALAEPKKANSTSKRPSASETFEQTVNGETVAETPAEPAEPELSQFDQASALNEQGLQLVDSGQREQGIELLEKAVNLLPEYAWFRFDLALALLDSGGESTPRADAVMQEGLALAPTDRDMVFASALYASRQNRDAEALAYLEKVPKDSWTFEMSRLAGRLAYRAHLDNLRELERKGDFDGLASAIGSNTAWRAEPEVLDYEKQLRDKASTRVEFARRTSNIDGTEGISKFESTENAFEVALHPNFSTEVFLRADRLSTDAGDYRNLEDAGDLVAFGQLGRFNRQQLQEARISPNDPQAVSVLAQGHQESSGFLLGAGVRKNNLRLDFGVPTGDMPVKSWVGGLRLDYDLPDGALFRVDLARRMVGGSLLSFAGATDPVSGESWGGARRNGANLLYYTPIGEDRSFVGIGRLNHITGKNIPDNTELNLQGIVSQTLWEGQGQSVEVSVSAFYWQFEKNLRLYTFGQGGYYSPQSFYSLTLPVTWTGGFDRWSWQVQASLGRSRSDEDDATLYPGRPDLEALAVAAGNPVTDEGGKGGGSSRGLRVSVERLLGNNLALGFNARIDRSEGYNPDFMTMYLRYVFPGENSLKVPPESLVPYSQF